MEHFCKNNKWLNAVNNSHKSASSQMFDRVLNTPLSSKKVRSSRPEVLCKKGVLRLETSPNSQENTCARVSFLIKLQVRKTTLPESVSKKRLWHRCFPKNFGKFLRTPFVQNTYGRLLLYLVDT